MKHVYQITSVCRGSIYGIGTYVEQMVQCLKHSDIAVTLVELRSSVTDTTVKIEKGVRRIYIPEPFYPRSDDDRRYEESAVYLLRDYVDDGQENIFHLHYMSDRFLASKLKQVFPAEKIVHTVHYTDWGLTLMGDREKMLQMLEKPKGRLNKLEKGLWRFFRYERTILNDYCDLVISISDHSYSDLVSIYKLDPAKLCLVNNAVRDCYKPVTEERKRLLREKFHIGPDEKVLIYAGRLDKGKGVHILAHALDRIVKDYPDVRLLLAGNGNFQDVMSSGISCFSKISYTGFVSKDVLYQLYALADIGVLPSMHEEFGYVAVEMMMHGLPVVVNNTTGLAEIVEDGISGLYVDLKIDKKHLESSVDDLADKLMRLIPDRKMQAELGQNGRRRYKERYDLKLFRRKMLDLYSSL